MTTPDQKHMARGTERPRGHSGFSLIELVVYLAVLAALSATAVNTIVIVHTSLRSLRQTRLLNATAAVAMERMTRVTRDAASVNAMGSALDISPGALSLTGGESPPLTHRFGMAAGALAYTRGGDPPLALTPPGVTIVSIVFHATSTTASEAVRIELTLAASTGRATTTRNYSSTVVLRNSYGQ